MKSILVILAMIIGMVILLMIIRNVSRNNKIITIKHFCDFNKDCLETINEQCNKSVKLYEKIVKGFEQYVNDTDALILQCSDEIPEELMKLLNLDANVLEQEKEQNKQVYQKNIDQLVEKINALRKQDFKDAKGLISKVPAKLEFKSGKMLRRIKKRVTSAWANLKKTETENEKLLDMEKKMYDQIQEFQTKNSNKMKEVKKLQNQPIECKLKMAWGAGSNTYMATKVCKNGNEQLKGYYLLDNLRVFGADGKTLGELLLNEKTGIIVFPYQQEDEVGLMFKSDKAFSIYENGTPRNIDQVLEAVLYAGNQYIFNTEAMQNVKITIESDK